MKTIFTAFLCLIAVLSFADVTTSSPFDFVGQEQLVPTTQEQEIEVVEVAFYATAKHPGIKLSGVLIKPLFGYFGKLVRENPMRLFWNMIYHPNEQSPSTYG